MGTTVFHMDTPEQASREVSHAVARALREAGISQRAAAEQAGIPLTTLTRRLSGRSPFLLTELASLAFLIGTTPSALMAQAEGQAA